MPIIQLTTQIRAPIEWCFDLARDIDLHVTSMKGSGERAVAGVTQGMISLGEEVTWEAIHFGIRQRLTSRITVFDRPRHFQDRMVKGAFKRFCHDHYFEHTAGVTTMIDIFDYVSPWGPFGRLADLLVLNRYLRRLLMERARVVRAAAESR